MRNKKLDKILLNTDRDIPLLCFLWKWKVSTTHAIATRFFPGVAVRNAYYRLCQLAENDFICCRVDSSGRKYVWAISRRGFDLIRSCLPNLKEEGFGSEHPGHDLVCSAVQLGDFLPNEVPGVELYSEQQLRRYDDALLPDEFPKRGIRRPDGFWYLTCGTKTTCIALEVELNPKSSHDYKLIGYHYGEATAVDQVVWVVKDIGIQKLISSSFPQSQFESRDIHSFILLPDFLKLGWSAKINFGHLANQALRSLILPKNQVVPQEVPSWCPDGASGHHLKFLCLSKKCHKSSPYQWYRPGDFS